MTSRPLHAVLLPAAAGAQRLMEALRGALDGTGPALLPVDPRLPAEQAGALLRALRPATLETQDGIQRLDPGDSPGVAPGTAVVIATSGSTGEPKGVELSAAALRHSARASLGRIGARPGEAWLSCLPPSHISGLQVFLRSLLSGVAPVVLDRLDAANAGRGAGGYVSLVPTQVRHLLDEPGGREALAGFRAILLGGAAVPAGLRAEAAAAGARVITTYGMSETCGGCVYDGEPLDGVSARIGPGGRIQLAGPVLFSGYRGRPGLTAAALDGGWFVTSDVGELDPAGRLTVRGRADGMINTGGEKVVGRRGGVGAGRLPGGPGGRGGRPARPGVGRAGHRDRGGRGPGGAPGAGRAARVRPRAAAGLRGAAGGRRGPGRPAAAVGQARPAGAAGAGAAGLSGPAGVTHRRAMMVRAWTGRPGQD